MFIAVDDIMTYNNNRYQNKMQLHFEP